MCILALIHYWCNFQNRKNLIACPFLVWCSILFENSRFRAVLTFYSTHNLHRNCQPQKTINSKWANAFEPWVNKHLKRQQQSLLCELFLKLWEQKLQLILTGKQRRV